MCGLSGVLVDTNLTTHAQQSAVKSLVSNLLYLNALRGMDATGVYSTSTLNLEHETFRKELGPAALFPIRDALQHKIWLNLIMTHNRAGTVGNSKDTRGAHPHRAGHIVLTHNGTVRRHGIPEEYRKYLNISDSFAITHLINDKGLKYAVEELDGSYTLVYFDQTKPSYLNFITNAERPLSIAKIIKDKKVYGIAWSSEEDTLEYAANRNGFTLRDQFTPEAYEHLSYNQRDGKFTTTTYKPKPRPVVAYYGGGYVDDDKKLKDMGINKEFPIIFRVDKMTYGSSLGKPVHPLDGHDVRCKSWRMGYSDADVGDYLIGKPQYVNQAGLEEKWKHVITTVNVVNLTRRGYNIEPTNISQLKAIRKAFRKDTLNDPKPIVNAFTSTSDRRATPIPLPHSGSTAKLLAFKGRQPVDYAMDIEEGPDNPLCLYCYTQIFIKDEPYARITNPMVLVGVIHNNCLDELIDTAEHFAHQIEYATCDDRKAK